MVYNLIEEQLTYDDNYMNVIVYDKGMPHLFSIGEMDNVYRDGEGIHLLNKGRDFIVESEEASAIIEYLRLEKNRWNEQENEKKYFHGSSVFVKDNVLYGGNVKIILSAIDGINMMKTIGYQNGKLCAEFEILCSREDELKCCKIGIYDYAESDIVEKEIVEFIKGLG